MSAAFLNSHERSVRALVVREEDMMWRAMSKRMDAMWAYTTDLPRFAQGRRDDGSSPPRSEVSYDSRSSSVCSNYSSSHRNRDSMLTDLDFAMYTDADDDEIANIASVVRKKVAKHEQRLAAWMMSELPRYRAKVRSAIRHGHTIPQLPQNFKTYETSLLKGATEERYIYERLEDAQRQEIEKIFVHSTKYALSKICVAESHSRRKVCMDEASNRDEVLQVVHSTLYEWRRMSLDSMHHETTDCIAPATTKCSISSPLFTTLDVGALRKLAHIRTSRCHAAPFTVGSTHFLADVCDKNSDVSPLENLEYLLILEIADDERSSRTAVQDEEIYERASLRREVQVEQELIEKWGALDVQTIHSGRALVWRTLRESDGPLAILLAQHAAMRRYRLECRAEDCSEISAEENLDRGTLAKIYKRRTVKNTR